MDQNFKIVQVEAGRDELVATADNFQVARCIRYRGLAMAEGFDRTEAGRAGGTQER
jgi:hypothetical protein